MSVAQQPTAGEIDSIVPALVGNPHGRGGSPRNCRGLAAARIRWL